MAEGAEERSTILIVEDEAVNVELFRATMSRAQDPRIRSARLLVARTLAEARGIIASEAIDLILLDVRLPDGVGLDLVGELQDAPTRPKVVILSASVLPEERAEARRAGADDFVGKPYRPSELTDRLAGLLAAAPPDEG